jgi:hypothetical protein
MLSTGTAYIIAHESEKNGIHINYGMDVLIESASLPKPQVSNHLHKWWEEK